MWPARKLNNGRLMLMLDLRLLWLLLLLKLKLWFGTVEGRTILETKSFLFLVIDWGAGVAVAVVAARRHWCLCVP